MHAVQAAAETIYTGTSTQQSTLTMTFHFEHACHVPRVSHSGGPGGAREGVCVAVGARKSKCQRRSMQCCIKVLER